MSEPSVNAMLDKLMSLTLLFLDVVVEICGCCDHCHGPGNLTNYDQAKAKKLYPFVCNVRLPLWKDDRCEDGLDHSGRVSQIVRHAIREEQECWNGCIWQVVSRVRPELQEMKNGKRSKEEPGPPKPVLLLKCHVEIQKHWGTKCDAESEWTNSNAGLWALMAGKEVFIGDCSCRGAAYGGSGDVAFLLNLFFYALCEYATMDGTLERPGYARLTIGAWRTCGVAVRSGRRSHFLEVWSPSKMNRRTSDKLAEMPWSSIGREISLKSTRHQSSFGFQKECWWLCLTARVAWRYWNASPRLGETSNFGLFHHRNANLSQEQRNPSRRFTKGNKEGCWYALERHVDEKLGNHILTINVAIVLVYLWEPTSKNQCTRLLAQRR